MRRFSFILFVFEMKVADGNWRRRVYLYAPVLIWIAVILFLGSGQGSMGRTSLVIRPILEFLFPSAPEATLQIYHGYIRKFAHFAEYAVLGLLACRAFFAYRLAAKTVVLMSIGLVFLIAAIDEFNQSFNPERTSSLIDVMLDVSGGVFGTLLYYLLRLRRNISARG